MLLKSLQALPGTEVENLNTVSTQNRKTHQYSWAILSIYKGKTRLFL